MMWEKFAYLATWVANSTGMRKRPVTFQQAMPRFKDDRPIDLEQRKREAMESFRFHKSKCWMMLRGASLDDIEILEEADAEKLMQKKQGGEN